MPSDLPQFYFRIRDNGATVFRVDTENRQRRIEMEEIATINVKNGNIKPHGEVVLTAPELAAIKDWLAARVATLAGRDVDDIHRAIDHMNLTTQWAQSRATDAQLDDVTDTLLLAMHDLRTVLVRKKSERLSKSAPLPE
jgi:phosphoserine phosphatase